MYCGSCLHDNTLAAALLELGEEVVLVPIYTPLRTDEKNVSQRRIFFGGINVYLQQKWRLFRHTPRWLDQLLDRPALLRSVTNRASSVDPTKLGGLTVSMLQGEAGRQRKELEKLVDWLLDEVQPEVIHLSNAMMLGFARMISERCQVPIVCSLSGEDLFLEKLQPPYYAQARQILRDRAGDIHAFVALNHYYADRMAEYLDVERERIRVIPHGLQLQRHGLPTAKTGNSTKRIGYLSRVCTEKGLHLLLTACEQLALREDVPDFELHAAGYLGESDRPYLRALQWQAERGPMAGKFHYHGELDRPKKISFLQSLDLFSTPTFYQESKGLPAMEALANSVPVVLPRHGSFPELVAETGGGLLHEPGDSRSLAENLAQLLTTPSLAFELGQAGRQAVHARFDAATMAEATRKLYQELVQP